jgi:2-dehydro-3-deoxygluconokinase
LRRRLVWGEVAPVNIRIVCIGECMVELAPAGAGLLRQGFAGDTFNTAWYLRRQLPAPWDVGYVTAVGDDPLSGQMVTFMEAAGLTARHVRRISGGTVGLYLISLERGERSFTYWRGQSAARRLADNSETLGAALQETGWIYFSGITLAILAPEDRERLLHCLREAKAAGARVVFDPNLRPRLWPDAGTMRREALAGAAVSSLVLPSFDEETRWHGDGDMEATLARYRSLGVETIVVKNGAGRIEAVSGDRRFHHDPQAVEPLDTTAAGDSFNAGVMAALATGSELPEALARGAALARRVIGGFGALVP